MLRTLMKIAQKGKLNHDMILMRHAPMPHVTNARVNVTLLQFKRNDRKTSQITNKTNRSRT